MKPGASEGVLVWLCDVWWGGGGWGGGGGGGGVGGGGNRGMACDDAGKRESAIFVVDT